MAEALAIKKEDVTCHVTLLGGGFGRKSKPDYVAEAALLSKQVGKPVKIVWTAKTICSSTTSTRRRRST